jgi:plastocyanin
MRTFITTGAVVVLGLSLWGCNGSGYTSQSSGNPTTPTPTTTPSPSDVVTVNVVGINGALSFSPNPATLPAGQTIIWHNIDTIAHHVVFDDRSVDTGDLPAGASSQLQTIPSVGGSYHCSIHPVMVGSVARDNSASPPSSTGY